MNPSDVAQLYRNQGRPVPSELCGKQEIKERAAKLGNVKKQMDGITFDSSMEATAYQILKQWELAGAISDLRMQPAFTLQERFKDGQGRTVRSITYSADFRFFDNESQRVRHVDVKGHVTQAFLKSMKQMKDKFPNIEIELWDRKKVKELSRC